VAARCRLLLLSQGGIFITYSMCQAFCSGDIWDCRADPRVTGKGDKGKGGGEGGRGTVHPGSTGLMEVSRTSWSILLFL